jgi:acyl carrier protein
VEGSIADQVSAVVSDLFSIPREEITPASSPETIEAWDSLQHLNLVMELEMTLGVKFTPKEIETMTSVAAIVLAAERKLGARDGTGAR